MPAPRFDVLGIGNAIVDVIARTDDDFLVRQGMRKGAMALIDEERADAIYDAMGPAVEVSGGSAANTIVGVASFGARAAFVGKVKDDELGRVFAHDIRAAGVAFDDAARLGRPVDRALLRAGDARRRAHHEHLSRRRAGPASERHRRRRHRRRRDHLSRGLSVGPAARQGGVPQGREDRARRRPRSSRSRCRTRSASTAIAPSFSISSATARSISSSPTSASCTASTRPPTSTPRVNALRNDARLAVITRSEKGCLVVTRGADRCGAGGPDRADGRCDRRRRSVRRRASWSGSRAAHDHRTAARLGALAAAEVIQHLGARPETSLKALAEQNGLDA